MNGLAAPSVVSRLGHLLVSPALSLQRLHLSPGLGAGCPLLHTQHEVPSCSLLSPCVGVTKSDLHTGETRTGKYNQELILGSFPGGRVFLVGYLYLSLLPLSSIPHLFVQKEVRLHLPVPGQITGAGWGWGGSVE